MSECYQFYVDNFQLLSTNILQAFLVPLQTEKKIFNYQAGQYIEFLLPGELLRPFSIANAPHHDKRLEFHIRHEKNNAYAQQLVNIIQASSSKIIHLTGPFGKLKYHCTPG